MSHRKLQVESTLKRTISQVLAKRVSDPRIVGMVSVTRVDVSPDLHQASVYVSVLPEQYQKRSIKGLQGAAGHIYSLVKKAMAMRTVPKLEFRLDGSLKRQDAIFDDIKRAIELDGLADADPPATAAPGTPGTPGTPGVPESPYGYQTEESPT